LPEQVLNHDSAITTCQVAGIAGVSNSKQCKVSLKLKILVLERDSEIKIIKMQLKAQNS
jgi:hypothetical protein